jgi:hypothetical protein
MTSTLRLQEFDLYKNKQHFLLFLDCSVVFLCFTLTQFFTKLFFCGSCNMCWSGTHTHLRTPHLKWEFCYKIYQRRCTTENRSAAITPDVHLTAHRQGNNRVTENNVTLFSLFSVISWESSNSPPLFNSSPSPIVPLLQVGSPPTVPGTVEEKRGYLKIIMNVFSCRD